MYRLPRQQDPYLPEGQDDSREKTPDEKVQAFTKYVQPQALRFPPYQYRPYPKWVGGDDGHPRTLVQNEGEHRAIEYQWANEDARASEPTPDAPRRGRPPKAKADPVSA
jgi:hypothetical protein